MLTIGQTIGDWTVMHDAPKLGHHRRWTCRCKCGVIRDVLQLSLRNGSSTSCGCVRKPTTKKHGMSKSPEYRCWSAIKTRCLNADSKDYPQYGGRGITVCDRWLNSFDLFYADMGPRPSMRHSVDRIDGSLGYCPENCRWAEHATQNRNRPLYNKYITYRGLTALACDWADHIGVHRTTIHRRCVEWNCPSRVIETPPKGVEKEAHMQRVQAYLAALEAIVSAET